MKKYLSLLIVLLMVFALETGIKIAKAEEGVTCTADCPGFVGSDGKTYCNKCVANREIREVKKEEVKNLKDKVAQLKEVKTKARTRVLNGLIHRTENLSNIADRIKSRIEKLKALSVDTSKAEGLVAQAEESIVLAKTNITKIQTSIENGDALETIKTNIVAVKDALKQAHTYLSQAVQELKMKMAEKKTDTTSTTETAQ